MKVPPWFWLWNQSRGLFTHEHSFGAMKRNILYSVFLLVASSLAAQVNMDNVLFENSPSLCQAGVTNKSPGKALSFSYTINPDYKMLPPDGEQPTKVRRNERFETRMKIPVVYAPKWKVMLGFDYTLERYHFLDIDPDNYPLFKHLNETDLKNAAVSASIFHPFNHKYYTSFRLSANWQGDYSSFLNTDSRYAVYRFTGAFGVKKRDNLEYGAGILVSKGYRGHSVVPFGFYNQTFNEHWGIETVLPSSVKIRYNFSEERLLMFGTELSSQNYALKVSEPIIQPENAPYHFRRASIDMVGSFYQKLTGWTWVQLKAGYAFDNNSDARDVPRRLTHQLKPSGSVIGSISFFISPSKQCLEKVCAQLPIGL